MRATARVTAGDLVRRGLRAIGVDAVYGAPLPGVPVVAVPDPAVAALLAEAHLLVHRTRCAVHTGAGALTVLDRVATWSAGAAPAGPAAAVGAAPVPVGDADALVGVWRDVDGALRARGPASPSPAVTARPAMTPPGAVRVLVALDPAGPVPDRLPAAPAPVDRWVPPDDAAVERLRTARSPVVLVGPGVAEPALVPGLHALAAAGSLGVLNTWGAKGVFDWRSRHHWATVGLQARDFALGGLAAADLIVASGLDGREAPEARWRLAPAVEVPPESLGPLAERWGRPRTELAVPSLRHGLAAVTQEGWQAAGPPLAPSRVTRTYAEVAGPGGLVVADPGTAGYWVARTFGTTGLGGAVVPARPGAAGLAAAAVVVARLRRPGRTALAVVDGDGDPGRPLDAPTAAVVEAAARLGVAVPVERWDPDGPTLDADAHAERLRAAVAAEDGTVLAVATDPAALAKMIDVAGEVVAWRPLGPGDDEPGEHGEHGEQGDDDG